MSSQWIHKGGVLAVVLLGMLALPANIWAQPANDNCAGAQLVTLGTTYTIDNQTATDEPLILDPGDCNNASLQSLTRGVWFRFDSTFDGALRCNETSTQNIAWGVWEMDTGTAACPSAGPATYCSANDDLQIRVRNNKTYYCLVHTDSATVSTVSLSVTFTQITPPANDTCDGATIVSSGTTFTSATTAYTNDLIDIGPCNLATLGNNMTRGVWFRYDHPGASPNQVLRLIETASAHDISVGVWAMPTASATCPTSGPATICSSGETTDFPVTPGNTYYMLVSTDSLAVSTTALNLTFLVITPPSNDDCANAQVVTLDVPYSITNANASSEMFDAGICHSSSLNGNTGMTAGVWFRYDSTITGVIRAAETSTQDIAAAVWEMDTAGATCPTSGPATWCAITDSFRFNVQSGKTYYILAFTDSLNRPTVPMSITFSQVLPPTNDDCSAAMAIVPDTFYTLDNTNAGDDLFNLPCAATVHGVASSGVWFKYDCAQTGTIQFSETSLQNIATGVWEMDTTSAACPTSATPTTFCSILEAFNMPVTSGKTYYFLVMNDATTAAAVPMSFSFYYVFPPANDDCANATVIPSLPARFVVDNRGATADAVDAGGCDLPNNSPFGVWFRYESGSTSGMVLVEQFNTGQQTSMGAWETGDCPTAAAPAIFCGDFGIAGTQRFGFLVTPNNTYYINMHMNSASAVPLTGMDVKFSFVPRAGDSCGTATPIVGTGIFTFHDIGATAPVSPFTTVPFSSETANAAMNLDSWYKWVAPASGKASIIFRGWPSAYPCRLAVYNESGAGACPTGTSSLIRCVNMWGAPNAGIPDGTVAGTHQISTWNVVSGKTYFFQFAGQNPQQSISDMELYFEPDSSLIGSCCIGSSCLLTSTEDCAARGGLYGGNGSACVSYNGTTSSYTGGAINMPGINHDSNGTITVPDAFTVEDVEVDVNITCPAQGDIRLVLVKDNAMVTFTNHGRNGYKPDATAGLGLSGVYTFSDAGTTSIFEAALGASIPAGTYRPAAFANINSGLRASFQGKSAAGVWTLIAASDGVSSSVVNSWTLRLKHGGSSACATVCCRGATCSTAFASAAECEAAMPQPLFPGVHSAYLSASTTCNAPGVATTPCCFANFNHNATLEVQDIFDFLNAWFAGQKIAIPGGDGDTGGLAVQNIFDFLNVWFAGGCS